MGLKLLITRNGKVLYEIPLATEDWARDELFRELPDSDREFKKLTELFDAFGNETRLKMMKEFIEDDDHIKKFTEFMELMDLNPKIIRENTRRLKETGLVKQPARGEYQISEVGCASFLAASIGLMKLLEIIRKEIEVK
jgi:predicted transcriptional regulator